MKALTLQQIQLWQNLGEKDLAIQGYLDFLEEHPFNEQAYHALTAIYVEQGKYDQAAWLWSQFGNLFYVKKDWEQAIAKFKLAISLDNTNVDACYYMGLAYQKQGLIKPARAAYQTVLGLASMHVGARFQLANLLMQENFYSEAIQFLFPLTQQYPFHFESQYNLAMCYVAIHRWQEALTHLQKAYDIQKKDSDVTYNLSVVYQRIGDFDKAIDYLLQTVTLSPQYHAAWFNLGLIHHYLHDNKNAKIYLQKALGLKPNHASTTHLLASLEQTHKDLCAPDYVTHLFDYYAANYDAHMLQTLHYHVPHILKNIIEGLKPEHHSLAILDLGCGTGLCGEALMPYAEQLIGVDLSAEMLKVAQSKQCYSELKQANILDYLQDTNQSFDLILTGDVLVYLGDLIPLFNLVNAALKPQGRFFFTSEISADQDFKLNQSGRFMHSKKYLDQIISKLNWRTEYCVIKPLRAQADQQILGHYYLVQKSV